MRVIAFGLGITLFALLSGMGGAAAPADLPGWGGARWGMTETEIEAVFGDALARLPGRWQYEGSYADRAVAGVSLGTVRFTAYLQMDQDSGRLRQVLLERRGVLATARAFREAVEGLRKLYGAPARTCAAGDANPTVASASWRFPTTAIHAAFTDFYTGAIMFTDPNRDADPLVPYVETRRNNPRFLPRLVSVRFHASDDLELGADDGCPAQATD